MYFQCGVENKPTVFLFNDIQVVEEGFLEDINNILSSGEVPNLYKPDEFEEVSAELFRGGSGVGGPQSYMYKPGAVCRCQG
jgi:hypothetical protein